MKIPLILHFVMDPAASEGQLLYRENKEKWLTFAFIYSKVNNLTVTFRFGPIKSYTWCIGVAFTRGFELYHQ
jgi:hypothetical protein